jgi:hypothetical protein
LWLVGPAAADDGPDLPAAADSIAASNRLTDPFHRPAVILLTAADAPWLNPPPREPMPVVPAPVLPQVAPTPPVQQPVTWSAPRRQPVPPPLPTSDRPMMPCEPVAIAPPPDPAPPVAPPVALAAPRMEPPSMTVPLAAPRVEPPTREGEAPVQPVAQSARQEPRSPGPAAPSKPKPAMTATTDDDFHAPKPITTCRFLDDPPSAKPPADDTILMAVIRRGGPAAGTAADIRKAVEATCKKAVDCQTEVAGERQLRVLLTVRSVEEWQRFYARLQELSDLGEYGLLFQVRIEKESK